MQQNDKIEKTVDRNETATKTPDESGHIHVDAFVRITDPETQEVIVEVRE